MDQPNSENVNSFIEMKYIILFGSALHGMNVKIIPLTTRADVRRIRSRTHSKEQSKFTNIHLFELVLNESA